ncbi:GNAT family N-acetyltransferase [Sporosarcina aquimarina]|uniref:GNAT family N-acetyltransferase n=1 Tax=Sporosarcina aquimarina TaxID=114975 RepID=A0ABU4FZV3_9BACL|nr:GNAT family N-acetyltransferase [Sporosarcina aquimarina]MDW0110248.1 GNAT family N-acetyltransferase [Sporosarcina aquimarina]
MNQVKLKDGTNLPVEVLTIEDLPEVKQLQAKVFESLANRAFLQPLEEEDFLNILGGNGVVIGVRSGGRLIAFRAMLDPGEDPEHLAKDARIPKEEWSTVLYSEITNVDPEFQGNGLQRQLGTIVFNEVDTNKYHYICATVAPYNIASIKDKLALGMHIAALSIKYETLTRYIMLKNLKKDVEKAANDTRKVSMGAIDEQQQLLKEGWIGTSIHEDQEGWTVVYQK